MKKSELKEIIKSEFLTEKKDSKKGPVSQNSNVICSRILFVGEERTKWSDATETLNVGTIIHDAIHDATIYLTYDEPHTQY